MTWREARRLYEEEGWSVMKVSLEMECDPSTAYRHLRAEGTEFRSGYVGGKRRTVKRIMAGDGACGS